MVDGERRNSVDPILEKGVPLGTSPYDHCAMVNNAQNVNGRSDALHSAAALNNMTSRVPNVINGYPSNPVVSSSSGGGLQIKDLYALGLKNGKITIPVPTNSDYRNCLIKYII